MKNNLMKKVNKYIKQIESEYWSKIEKEIKFLKK